MSSSGLAFEHLDPATRAQDDLYRHVNGQWLDGAVIPDDRSSQGAFIALRDEAELAVRAIVEEAAAAVASAEESTDLQRKIGNLYTSFMDEERIEADGLAPVAGWIERVYATDSVASLTRLMGELARHGVGGLHEFYVNNDVSDPTRYLFHLHQGGLGLPDESYYRADEFADIRDSYVEHARRMLALASVPAPAEAAQNIMALESRLAGHHLDSVSCRDPQRTHNLMDASKLVALAPGIGDWFAGVEVPEGKWAEVDVAVPDFVEASASLLASVPLAHWQHWLTLRLLHAAAPYLSSPVVAEHFAFYGTVLSGTPVIKERWKRGVALVEGALGEAVGQLYVDRHFPPEHKARMEQLVANLMEAYRQGISSLEWMSDATIKRALEKLDKFTPKIGYPERWIDYTALEPSPDDVYGNVRDAESFELDRQLAKIGRAIDRQEWLITPQTVNAYYNPSMNEIVFPAAILQPPFFDADADMAVNYGGIGAVIGHEIGHGFDDQGSQFDGDGALRNWWTDADRTAFETRTARLVDQYSALSPSEAPDSPVNGELTLGENIGDLGGLTIGVRAYRISLDGEAAPVIDGYTGEQRLFHSWARVWCQVIRPEEASRRLTIDPHSPNEFRCNAVVRNMDEFHAAFDVESGDGMWLDPADRVRIW